MKAEIRIQSAGTDVEPAELNRAVRSIEFEVEVGTAAVVRIELGLWDTDAMDYDAVAVNTLVPGDEFELWETEGETCLGLFRIEERETSYTAEGPVATITAYDALRRLVRTTKGRVIENARTAADALRRVAAEHGLELDMDAAELHVLTDGGKPVDRVKELGKSDLDWVNGVAMAEGLGMPWVRYDPVAHTETLVLRRLDLARQSIDSLDLRVVRPDGDGDLAELHTRWDMGDIPEAVEVIGVDPSEPKATRKPYRVTVVATPAGPQASVERNVRLDEFEKLDPAGRKALADGSQVLLLLLGSQKEQADVPGAPVQRRLQGGKVRRWRPKREFREVLYHQFVSHVADAKAYAIGWMVQRMAAYYTAEGSILPDAEGAARLNVSQVHGIRGTAPEGEGYYILTRVAHTFGAQHECSFSAQRLLEVQVG